MNPATRSASRRGTHETEKSSHRGLGLSIPRLFTTPGSDPLEEVQYEKRTSRITNTDGSVVFEMHDAEIPATWSQVATDIMVSKYFRKAEVPQVDALGNLVRDEKRTVVTGPERSVKQVIGRLATCWRRWGERYGYFETSHDAQAFEDELKYMLVWQMAAPNSPQWFNTGLHEVYGITGPSQGHYYCVPETGEVRASEDAYTHPQPHACFIQSVEDDMVNEGGIMDLWVREARLFKYGSGTGTNFSNLRGAGEPLSGGGKSSGLMSFLKIGDRAAGAIKSGGTTRRAAKMVCLDLDHPDIETFIDWKVNEEKKVAALVKEGYPVDFNGEAYQTVSGQNSNNSVRVPFVFFEALEKDADWKLFWRTELRRAEREGRDPKPSQVMKARELWDRIGYAAWACADPGVQYDTTINDWHTCPEDGPIRASNPCSEYMFLDNTACNLASINLLKFYDEDPSTGSGQGTFDIEKFQHAVRLWTVVLEISVLMAQFPSREIARLSYGFRTLGLGYANLGALLMRMGIPYDSEKGRAICGAITAILTAEGYAASAEMAKHLGPFPGFSRNREHMLRVIRNHRRAAYDAHVSEYEKLHVPPVGLSQKVTLPNFLEVAKECWDRALASGEEHGYRNAQVTVIAPTGTIGLLMDCDTTGVEPDFALVKFKKLAGGGYMKIANQSVKPALKTLGYSEGAIADIMRYVMGTLTLEGAPHVNRESLRKKGLTDEDIAKVEKTLPQVFDIQFAFNRFVFGEPTMKRLGCTEVEMQDSNFNLLRKLGFTKQQIEEGNTVICGHMTVEGAPHLQSEHLPVFDCANTCGKIGKRFIPVEGHIRMMASAQPFISGAISKTINLPAEATVEDIKNAYFLSAKLGLKANALYRDGCKLSQALSSTSDKEDKEDKEVVERIVVKEVPRRRKLPEERPALTHKFSVAGHEGYVHVGLYDDGSPGEIFIKMSKEGSTLSGVMDTLALSLSMNLQYGVPLEVLCGKLVGARFEPMGMTANKEIPMVKSLMDYLGRWLALKFLSKEKAKQFHSSDLVEKAYREGSKSKDAFAMRLPVLDAGVELPTKIEVAGPEMDLDMAPSKIDLAKQQGYSGSICGGCGSLRMKANGSCEVCLDCGATSGCS